MRIAVPLTSIPVARICLVFGVLLWLALCAKFLIAGVNSPKLAGLIICALVILAPLIVAKISKLAVYLLAVYAAAIPLSALIGGGGLTLMKLLAIAAAGALILSALARGTLNAPTKQLWALVLLALYAGASVFWAIDSGVALAAYTVLLTYGALFIITSLYPFTTRESKLVLAATVFGGMISAFCGDYLFWHGQQFTNGSDAQAGRLFIGYNASRSIDPNQFDAMLLIPIAIIAVMFVRARFGIVKAAYSGALLLLLLAFALSASRGAAIGLAVMFAYAIWRSRRKFALTLAGVICIVAFVNSPLFQRFAAPDINSADGRFDIWKVGAISLQRYWLTGAGVGNFNAAFHQYYFAVPHLYLSWDRIAHSVLLQSAVEYGIIGFVLVMSLWYFAFRDLAQPSGGGLYSDLCAGLRAGILGLFVAGFSLDLMNDKYVWLILSLPAVMRAGLRHGQVSAPRHQVETAAQAGSPAPLIPTYAEKV